MACRCSPCRPRPSAAPRRDGRLWAEGLALCGVLVLAGTSCVAPGMLTDGSSVSVGTHSRGALRHGTTLPFRGEGYLVPERWKERGRNHGTEELVQLIVRVARRVRAEHRRGTLGVADLSAPGGGPTLQHRSHHSGRDVDLIFYALDEKGRPVVPKAMIYFDEQGNSVPPEPADAGPSAATNTPTHGGSAAPDAGGPTPPEHTPLRLDLARNWSLVRALVTDPQVPVQWIFVGRPIARLLLRHARRKGEPEAVIERAARVLHQPSDSLSHMDHFHVRIFCPFGDRYQGCIDRGPARWFKKSIKYVDPAPPPAPLPRSLAALSLSRLRLPGLF